MILSIYIWIFKKETRVKNTSREEPLLKQFTIVKNPLNFSPKSLPVVQEVVKLCCYNV